MAGASPDELESLLEDAVLLRDAAAVTALFEPGGVLVAGSGAAEVGAAARRLCAGGIDYLAEPRRVLRTHGLALMAGESAVTVARPGVDGMWRYAFAVFRHPMSEEGP